MTAGESCGHQKTLLKLDAVGRAALEQGREPCKPWSFVAGAEPFWICSHRKVCATCGVVVAYGLGSDCPRVPEWRSEGGELEVAHSDVPRKSRGRTQEGTGE